MVLLRPAHEASRTASHPADWSGGSQKLNLERRRLSFLFLAQFGRFEWTFEKAAPGTRITQRCTLEGDRASVYAKDVGPTLEAGIPEGMRKLADAMEQASRKPEKSDGEFS